MEITRELFLARVGREPEDDDLDRCNCNARGIGHQFCGWDIMRGMPNFIPGPSPTQQPKEPR